MEMALVGENLYIFSFNDQTMKDRILLKQPWNFHGALVLMDTPHEHGGPTDFNQFLVPFWIQIYGLPYGAMNRQVGVDIGSLVGEVLDVTCNGDGVGWASALG